jgi:iron(III) transport system ATP-binding protein
MVEPESRHMGMVFQSYAIWPHMTVFENVAFGLRIAKVDSASLRRRVEEMLTTVGLEGMGGRYPSQLSGGQQQRVALARSLVIEPSIILLDEPLSNLDAKLREHMRAELKALQRRTGITFVYVTHDQAEALSLSDWITVFNNGVIQQQGAPMEIYERPGNLFVAEFLGAINRLAGTIVSENASAMTVDVGAMRLVAKKPGAEPPDRSVVVVVRPESVLIDAPESGENCFEGRVRDITYLGSIVELLVDLGGQLLRVQGAPSIRRAVGEAVRLTIPKQACLVMSAQ